MKAASMVPTPKGVKAKMRSPHAFTWQFRRRRCGRAGDDGLVCHGRMSAMQNCWLHPKPKRFALRWSRAVFASRSCVMHTNPSFSCSSISAGAETAKLNAWGERIFASRLLRGTIDAAFIDKDNHALALPHGEHLLIFCGSSAFAACAASDARTRALFSAPNNRT